MKNNRKYISAAFLLISLFSGFMLAGCDQEALFWVIAHELPPIGPVIGGHPSPIVLSANTLYVSNDVGIWYWDIVPAPDPVIPNWTLMYPQPQVRIRDLAVVGTTLFALDFNGTVHVWNGTNWSDIDGPGTVQRIFGAGSFLFAGTFDGVENYAICSMSVPGTALSERQTVDGLLRGAAQSGGTYVLGTQGDGLYTGSGTSISKNAAFPDYIMGLTEFAGQIYIVARDRNYPFGSLYRFGDPTNPINSDLRFTGAISGWEKSPTERLLLLGIQGAGGSFANGYREIQIGSGGSFSGSFAIPGIEEPSSMESGTGNNSAIRSRAINHLYAMPSSYSSGDDIHRPLIFASTQSGGLWSYRFRNGTAQWNGENNR